jgi:[acyl-carrier-protein] S-malonyltransferase
LTNIVVAPGQGSQSQGFLKPWIQEVSGFEVLLKAYSSAAELDLITLGTEASEDEIKDTAVAQPLIVAASLAAFRTMPHQAFDMVAGHSVGEFAAAAIAGVIRDEDAISLVSVRARAMAQAAAETDTGMAAVIGGEEADIQAKLAEYDLVIANYNGGSQVVAAGLSRDIAKLIANPPEKARVIELKVAGAFHTKFMDAARAQLMDAAAKIEVQNPTIALFSNEAGQRVDSGREFLDLLVHQVSNPVRWDKVMKNFEGLEAQVVELPPAGALSGLLKRAVQDCRTVPLRNPQDFEKVA